MVHEVLITSISQKRLIFYQTKASANLTFINKKLFLFNVFYN